MKKVSALSGDRFNELSVIRLTITHKSGRVENKPSSRDIGETLPTSPQDSNARLSIMFAVEKTAKLGNPKSSLGDGRRHGGNVRGAMVKSIKRLPFMWGQDESTRGIRVMSSNVSEPEETPSNDTEQGDERD